MKATFPTVLFTVFLASASSAKTIKYTSLLNESPSQPRCGLGIALQWSVRYQVIPDSGLSYYQTTTEGTFWIYRNGILIKALNNTGGYVDYDTVAGVTYSYTVTASLGSLSWTTPMTRTCVCSYEMSFDNTSYAFSPEVNWVSFDGVLKRLDYTYPDGPLTTATSTPAIKSIDCDWIRTVTGYSAKQVLANETGATRVAHVKMSYATKTETDIYDNIVTVTQLPNKIAANGKDTYWDCHVAGIDYDNPEAEFKAYIDITNGVPSISWSPALNGDRVKNGVRTYTVSGTKSIGLDAKWETVEDGLETDYNFFKVSVSMPQ